MDRTNEKGDSEEAFFQVLSCADFWKEFKKYMFPNKRKSDFYNYKDGDIAAHHGYFSLILERNNLIYDHVSSNPAIDYAASKGRLDIVKYLYYNKTDRYTNAALDYAMVYGHIDVVKFLCEEADAFYTTFGLNHVAANGHLDVLQYLHDKSYDRLTNPILSTHDFGYLVVPSLVHYSRNVSCSNLMMSMAIQNKHIDVVKFLLANEPKGNLARISQGHFNKDFLAVLYSGDDNGPSKLGICYRYRDQEWQEMYQISNAVRSGNLEMVKLLYLHRRHYIVHSMMYAAIYYSQQDIINFTFEQIEDIGDLFECLMKYSCSVGHLQVMEYLYTNTEVDNLAEALYQAYYSSATVYNALLSHISKDLTRIELDEIVAEAKDRNWTEIIDPVVNIRDMKPFK